MTDLLANWYHRLPRLEGGVIFALLIATLCIWGFGYIANEVYEEDYQDLDEKIVMAFRSADDPTDPIGSSMVEQAATDMTALGGMAVVIIITLSAVIWCILHRHWGNAVYIALAIVGGVGTSMILKTFYSRPRPSVVPHGTITHTYSFPSGHATTAAVTYLTLAVLLAQITKRRTGRAMLIVLAVLLTLAIGLSRVYLGVHYLSDVIAGWALGMAWAAFAWLIAHMIWKRTGLIDEEDDPKPLVNSESPRLSNPT